MRVTPVLTASALLAAYGLVSAPTYANPRPLPFTYTYETLPEGSLELEQFADLIPLKALGATSGVPTDYVGMQLQTEFEYGITDHLELGLYFTLVPETGESLIGKAALLEGNGTKQRVRYRFGETGEWPVDVAVYGEIVESDHEVELEGKIILQKRIRNLRLVTNLWAEHEWYYTPHTRDWVLNPTLGATYEVTPTFSPGLEAWMRWEFPNPEPASPKPFNAKPHVYLGPTVMLNLGKIWWTTGLYVRLDDAFRTMQPGDTYGNIWARTMIGVGF